MPLEPLNRSIAQDEKVLLTISWHPAVALGGYRRTSSRHDSTTRYVLNSAKFPCILPNALCGATSFSRPVTPGKILCDCKLGVGAVANGLLPHNPLPCNEISYASWIDVFSLYGYKFMHRKCGKSQGEREVNFGLAKISVCYMDVFSPSQTFIICSLISL
jgi:hypothetical protein